MQRLLDVRWLLLVLRLLRGRGGCLWRRGRNEETVQEERDFPPDSDVGILQRIAKNVPALNFVHLLHSRCVVLEQAGERVHGFGTRFARAHCWGEEG